MNARRYAYTAHATRPRAPVARGAAPVSIATPRALLLRAAVALLSGAPSCVGAHRSLPPAPAADAAPGALVVRQPTVVAYLVVPPGAVDTQPELAVLADDWAYAMAALGERVAARGFAFALATEPVLVVRRRGRAAPDTIPLRSAGYLLIPVAGHACAAHEAVEPEAVLGAATRYFRKRVAPSGVWRCPSH